MVSGSMLTSPSESGRVASDGPPRYAAAMRWLVGVMVAAIPAAYGIVCVVTGRAVFFGDAVNLDLRGAVAVAYGMACIAVGVFVHLWWFWGMREGAHRWRGAAVVATVLVFLASFGYVAWRIVVDELLWHGA